MSVKITALRRSVNARHSVGLRSPRQARGPGGRDARGAVARRGHNRQSAGRRLCAAVVDGLARYGAARSGGPFRVHLHRVDGAAAALGPAPEGAFRRFVSAGGHAACACAGGGVCSALRVTHPFVRFGGVARRALADSLGAVAAHRFAASAGDSVLGQSSCPHRPDAAPAHRTDPVAHPAAAAASGRR